MLQIICSRSNNNLTKPQQFSHLLQYLVFVKSHLFVTASSTLSDRTRQQQPLSDINFVGITQSVINKPSDFFPVSEGKVNCFRTLGAPLNRLLWDISDIIPDVTRRFKRYPILQPQDVLEILLGFRFESRRIDIQGEKVESLWRFFNWATTQGKWFKHFPKSCEVMASLLLQSGMLTEVQSLVLEMVRHGISLDGNEIFDGLIRGYVDASDSDRAGLMYERMCDQGLVPSPLCYQGLLDLLVRMKRTELALEVCLDMLKIGIRLNNGMNASMENVGRLLCMNGMIQQARRLVKKAMALGFEPSSLLLDEIACGYCAKYDYEDALKFFAEMKYAPSVLAGKKIIWSICCNFDVESANSFRLKIESLGFRSDEMTFGILISQCCKEGNLRNAFVYLSEMGSRGLKPDFWTYNALMAGVLKEGMWEQARDIVDEMIDAGITPRLSTFRVLLAGYFKVRKFEEAKSVICEMGRLGLFDTSSVEEPLSKAFVVLGFNPTTVRFKRDSGRSLLKKEFSDHLGNGLYMDADIEEFEYKVSQIMEDSLIPDFNLLLRKECDSGNFKGVFSIVDEMVQWGQEPTADVFATMVKGLCGSRSQIRLCSLLIEKMPRFLGLLDQEVLNCLVQAYCKISLADTGRIIVVQMIQRNMMIDSATFTALITALCKKGNLSMLHECWDSAWNHNWLPHLENCKRLLEGICSRGMLKESLELLERMLVFHPNSRPEICHMFLEKLSSTGFASVACLLAEELERHGVRVDGSSYTHLVAGLWKERKYADAYKVFSNTLAGSLALGSDVSVFIIPHLCKVSIERANATEGTKLREDSPSSFSIISSLYRRFGATGNVKEAASLLQGMSSKGLLMDAEICEMLFQGYCKARNLGKAKEMLGVLMRKSLRLSILSYRNWVRLMCSECGFNMALNLKDVMVRETEYDSLVIYNILVFSLLSAGNKILARRILNEMEAKGLVFNDATYNFLIYGFSKCKDASSSLYYLYDMVSKGLRPSNSSLRSLVSCLLEQDNFSKVLELSREIESRGWVHDSFLQNAVAGHFLCQNKFEHAENFLNRIAEKGLIPDAINYDGLIKRFCRYGRTSTAVDLLNIMLKKRNLPNWGSYDCIIQSLCKCNKVNEALDFQSELLDMNGKPSMKTWSVLIQSLCQQGRTAEAEELLHGMVAASEVPGKELYMCVIDRYHAENNVSKSTEVMRMMQESGHKPDFESHWSVISNLSSCVMKENKKSGEGFLSGLLSGSGYQVRKDLKIKSS
ncbi:Pentatricopeptide repeat-containing protein At5g15280, mitochondrial [Linum perenne]